LGNTPPVEQGCLPGVRIAEVSLCLDRTQHASASRNGPALDGRDRRVLGVEEDCRRIVRQRLGELELQVGEDGVGHRLWLVWIEDDAHRVSVIDRKDGEHSSLGRSLIEATDLARGHDA
jgi:hypothetical protein